MATGFELAGIILAALPLLINAMEHRDVCLQPLNSLIFKKKHKEMIQKTVKENSVLFRHCCEKMLSIAEVENIADLLAKDNGNKVRDLWADPSLELRLKSAFGQDDFNVIQCRLIEIEALINKLQTDPASLFKQAFKGITQAKEIELLGKAIFALKTVLDGESLSVVIGTAGTAWQNEIDDMKTTRTHLLNIHSCVDATWGCGCKSEHVINFQCKYVEDGHLTIILAATSARPKSEPTKAPWVLRPLRISPCRIKQSQKTKIKSNDLCKSLEDQKTVSRLSAPSASQDFFYRIKASTQLPDPKALVPLSDSLKRGSDHAISLRENHGHRVLLKTPRDRIAVGARLMMAVLQQHNAPWLQPIWTTEDVLLRAGSGCSLQPYFEAPFGISSSSSTENASGAKLKPFFSRNATLYSLGVALIEIAMNDTMENLITDEDREISPDPAIIRAVAALRLSEELADHFIPPEYRDATRYCLKGEFGTEIRGKELSDDDLFSVVYRKAAKPLMELVSENVY